MGQMLAHHVMCQLPQLHPNNTCRRALLLVCILWTLPLSAPAKVFAKSFLSSSATSTVTAPTGSHTFSIPDPLPLVRIDWYLDNVKHESDLTGVLATPPKFIHTFGQSQGDGVLDYGYRISARIYTQQISGSGIEWVFSRSINWKLRAGLPDLLVSSAFISPSVPVEGQSFKILTTVNNVGGVKAAAGALDDQIVHFHFDNSASPISVEEYDDVDSTSSGVEVESQNISFAEVGMHSIKAVADASGAIDEFDELNNEYTFTIQVRGKDWLLVPIVIGKREKRAKDKLSEAGFANVNVDLSYDDTVPAGTVISQSPNAGAWFSPADTVQLKVSLGPACDIAITKPRRNRDFELGQTVIIKWTYDAWCCEDVTIDLYLGHVHIRTIKDATENDGKLRWKIAPSRYMPGENYQIHIQCGDEQGDLSSTFSIVSP
ncbi:MAG: PASTA domain-containing protein [Candidatus Hydrogenedentes bacterium]|nr:PASTA domain-containing protein [Candidatus Hydrogenedentota bacterium]